MKNESKFEGYLTKALKDFRFKLESWNKDTFGNVVSKNEEEHAAVGRTAMLAGEEDHGSNVEAGAEA